MIILRRKILKKTSNLFTIFLVLLFVFFAVGFY
ncbi:cytochrome c nitrite reductase small subunit, partial [Campylobacter jejuni]|nr:cytochrome c nitrite reductase small subunit [Campylobacter jejuni]